MNDSVAIYNIITCSLLECVLLQNRKICYGLRKDPRVDYLFDAFTGRSGCMNEYNIHSQAHKPKFKNKNETKIVLFWCLNDDSAVFFFLAT